MASQCIHILTAYKCIIECSIRMQLMIFMIVMIVWYALTKGFNNFTHFGDSVVIFVSEWLMSLG